MWLNCEWKQALGIKGKMFAKKRYAEKAQMKKTWVVLLLLSLFFIRMCVKVLAVNVACCDFFFLSYFIYFEWYKILGMNVGAVVKMSYWVFWE